MVRVEDQVIDWLNRNAHDYWQAAREFLAFCGVVAIAMMWLLVVYVWGAPAG